ncbi:MAG: hypothetical protein LBG72_09240 [Spirochaetaceae bacterium]|jgi:hypothetical protein|nr:hypothetical protein [Spirochaetaceae bacterium]
MTKKQYKVFCGLREMYQKLIHKIDGSFPALRGLQQSIAETRQGGSYLVETPVVYNTAMDKITEDDEIKLILVGDNPGRQEQAAHNRAYLVGNSGKIADKFFASHKEFNIEFRKNVLIQNKTPVHTARTNELSELLKQGGRELAHIIYQSQIDCAKILYEFWRIFSEGKAIPVWIIGYSEMKKKGIFEAYTEELTRLARADSAFESSIFFYRHFSMNQFTIDLKRKRAPDESVKEALNRIGAEYRRRIMPAE